MTAVTGEDGCFQITLSDLCWELVEKGNRINTRGPVPSSGGGCDDGRLRHGCRCLQRRSKIKDGGGVY